MANSVNLFMVHLMVFACFDLALSDNTLERYKRDLPAAFFRPGQPPPNDRFPSNQNNRPNPLPFPWLFPFPNIFTFPPFINQNRPLAFPDLFKPIPDNFFATNPPPKTATTLQTTMGKTSATTNVNLSSSSKALSTAGNSMNAAVSPSNSPKALSTSGNTAVSLSTSNVISTSGKTTIVVVNPTSNAISTSGKTTIAAVSPTSNAISTSGKTTVAAVSPISNAISTSGNTTIVTVGSSASNAISTTGIPMIAAVGSSIKSIDASTSKPANVTQ